MSESPFTIELAGRDDVAEILAIANWAAAETPANFATAPEPLDEWLALYARTHEQHPWLVARSDGRVVGFAKSGPYKPRGAYRFCAELSVYIAQPWHGRGVAQALYGKLLPILRAQGYVQLFAGITSPHPPSERLHAKFGFTQVGILHRCGWKFDRWHDVGFWELSLQPEGPPHDVRPVRDVWPLAF